ncbi:MAG: hypothetical protein AAGH79_15565 [Bacteroidota bacterium]
MGFLGAPRFWDGSYTMVGGVLAILVAMYGGFLYKRHTPVQRRLFYYVAASASLNYFTRVDWAVELFEPPTNAPYFHFISIILFFLLVNIYRPFLRAKRPWKPDLILILIFTLFAFWNMIWGDGIMLFNAKALGLYSFLLIALTVFYFASLLNSLMLRNLEQQPLFWVSAGLLVYCAGNFLLWLSANTLLRDWATFDSMYQIHTTLFILLSLTFFIAFSVKPTPESSESVLGYEKDLKAN